METCDPDDSAYRGQGARGLTKRELFAAMMLQGLSADPEFTPDEDETPGEFKQSAASFAVGLADALIVALNKPVEAK